MLQVVLPLSFRREGMVSKEGGSSQQGSRPSSRTSCAGREGEDQTRERVQVSRGEGCETHRFDVTYPPHSLVPGSLRSKVQTLASIG